MVRDLNTKIQVFPSNIIAGIFGFKKMDFFGGDMTDAERQPRASEVLMECHAGARRSIFSAYFEKGFFGFALRNDRTFMANLYHYQSSKCPSDMAPLCRVLCRDPGPWLCAHRWRTAIRALLFSRAFSASCIRLSVIILRQRSRFRWRGRRRSRKAIIRMLWNIVENLDDHRGPADAEALYHARDADQRVRDGPRPASMPRLP